ncbi:MAG: hypothetical protein RID94_07820 [Miltoncostaeaceae bacterium]
MLRRTAVLASVMAIALLALVGSALGAGRDVIADYQANGGQIVGCYSAADYREALRILRTDEALYDNAIEVIQEARTTNVAREGEPCEPAQTAPDEAVEDEGGSGLGLWLGLAAAVALVAVGAGLVARRSTGGEGEGGEDGPGDGSAGPPA